MLDNKLYKAESYLLQHKEDILKDLFSLCRIPSVGGPATIEAPFGDGVRQMLSLAAQLFTEAGCKVTASPFYMYATLGEGKKTIGIFTHGDVVPADDDWLYTTPFSPLLKNGVAIGRGVEDNKSGIVAALYAVKAARYAGILPQKQWLVFVGGDEERAMRDVDEFLAAHHAPDLSLVPDNSFPLCYGEKGIAHFDAVSKKTVSCLLDAWAGTAYNIIPDEASVRIKKSAQMIEEITALVNSSNIFTWHEDYSSLTLTAHGISGHAAYPDGTDNAIFLLFSALARLTALENCDRAVFRSIAALSESCYGEVFDIKSSDSTFGPLSCVSSMLRFNEGKLSLGFDIRYGTAYTGFELKQHIDRALHALGFFSKHFSANDGFNHEKNTKAVSVLMDAYRNVTGDDASPYTSAGGTYARKLKNAYSIGTHYPETIPSFLPGGHGGAHQKDEALNVDAFLTGIKLLLHMLIAADGL